MTRLALLLVAALFALPTLADDAGDGAAWLSRMMAAAQRLSYSGTFVYQSGTHSETSRVVRVVDEAGERERLEVLDGSPREVVRVNDEVRCYLPDDQRVVVEKRSARRGFPALFSGMGRGLGDHYVVRVAEIDRIAGVEARQIILEPRDAWRYGYRLWADVATGLLLRARTVDDKGRVVEQFAFTQFSPGVAADAGDAGSRMQSVATRWRVEQLDAPQEVRHDESKWRLRQSLPGFVKTTDAMRHLKEGAPAVSHVVYSDGVAAVSLFVGPADAFAAKGGASRHGAVNRFSRRVGELKVMVIGEVPMATVRHFAEMVDLVRQ